MDSQVEHNFGGLNGRGRPHQDPPIEREMSLTLEEIYNGCTKKMKISRRVRKVLLKVWYHLFTFFIEMEVLL